MAVQYQDSPVHRGALKRVKDRRRVKYKGAQKGRIKARVTAEAIAAVMESVACAIHFARTGPCDNGDACPYSHMSYDQFQRAIGDSGNSNGSNGKRTER